MLVSTMPAAAQVKFEGLLASNYLGDTLIVKPGDQTLKLLGYYGFYKKRFAASQERFLHPKNEDIIYPGLGGASSIYDSLVLKKFVCKNVYPVKDDNAFKYFYLELFNQSIGTLFFRYSTANQWEFPFIMDGDYIDGKVNYCKELRYEKDKFDDSETWKTPSEFVDIIKKKSKGTTGDSISYTLLLKQVVKDPIFAKGGVIVLLKSGERMTFSEASVETKVNRSSLILTATVLLKRAEIDKIIESQITAYRIQDVDTEVRPDYGIKYGGYLKCMINSN